MKLNGFWINFMHHVFFFISFSFYALTKNADLSLAIVCAGVIAGYVYSDWKD